MSPEFIEALKLVEQYDQQRPKHKVEYRLYYDADGRITGYCEVDHPDDPNFIVIDNPDVYFKTNTEMLRVVNGQLKKISLLAPEKRLLIKSLSGQPVVANKASIALYNNEEYNNIEYYDRPTNS
jgi:hypothetical protein